MMVISTSFSYGRNGSDMIVPCSPCTAFGATVRTPQCLSLAQCFIRLVRRMDADNGGMFGAWLMCYGGVVADLRSARVAQAFRPEAFSRVSLVSVARSLLTVLLGLAAFCLRALRSHSFRSPAACLP